MAVIVAVMMFLLLVMCGMAIDIGFLYNRKVEVQNLADAVALAAANELDGTAAGVTRAANAAATVARTFSYRYGAAVTWSDAALLLSDASGADSRWRAPDVARSAPGGIFFARVDTAALDPDIGTVSPVFMNLVSSATAATLQGRAIAGRTAIRAAPLAICALSPTPAASRVTDAGDELTEFGFRRGIAYDLMQLNSSGAAPENFLINPFAPPGTVGTAGPTAIDIVGPYVCNGTMSVPRVTGGTITVVRPFPLASLFNHLNSRFDQLTACKRSGAPPDANVKSFAYNVSSWMSITPSGQGAALLPPGERLATVADASPTPLGTTAAMFGPLWSFARAVPFSAYVAGSPEPAAGYATFPSSAWPTLYSPGAPAAGATYPAGTPYAATSGTYYQAPTGGVRGLRNRRVLNVPLLSCPVPAGSPAAATVLGVGKFFMTVPATSANLFAEFGGVVSEQSLGSSVVLFP